MAGPLDKAAARAPATLGEGCLSRYDLEALDADAGTEFSEAAELWRQLHERDEPAVPQAPDKA